METVKKRMTQSILLSLYQINLSGKPYPSGEQIAEIIANDLMVALKGQVIS
jgi:hypothetical protein